MATMPTRGTMNRTRIAYITDLHLSSGTPRINNLTDKMSSLRRTGISAFFLGGDLLPMGPKHWPILKEGLKGRPGIAQKTQMKNYIKTLGGEVLPKMREAAGDVPMFFCHGNADYLGYEYMRQFFPAFNLPDTVAPFPFNGFNIIGTGGVPAEKEDGVLRPYAENSEWFKGNIKAEVYLELLNSMRYFIGSDTILMTHIPAKGHVDIFKGEHQGYEPLATLIEETSPLLHLTGHVHDAPLFNGGYSFDRAFSVISGKTLSVNPGGGNCHNNTEGIRGALIDLTGLKEMRSNGTLTQQTAAEVIEAV